MDESVELIRLLCMAVYMYMCDFLV
jgi:hypothetical protein